jgi:hypothetical protein
VAAGRDWLADGSSFAKRLMGKKLFSPFRLMGTALLTPLRFSYRSGHLQSSLKARAVNRRGEPVTWYTFPANDFLEGKGFGTKRVLEFGAGQSTLWWAKRAALVVSFEANREWFDRLKGGLTSNTRLHLIPESLEGIEELLPTGPFDVIVIDGLDRLRCARFSVRLVSSDGAIILDDSEGYWGGERHSAYPILDLLRTSGFQRVDFFGYAPGVIRPHCTSVFFRGQCFLFAGTEPPRREIHQACSSQEDAEP